jgi:hypothetical protein
MDNGFNNTQEDLLNQVKLPLVNMSKIHEWQKVHEIVNGTAPRWLFPVLSGDKVDSLIMVMNISHEISIGSAIQAGLSPL